MSNDNDKNVQAQGGNVEGSKTQVQATNNKEERVEIDKAVLDILISELKDLKKQVGEIESTADRDQVARIEKLRSEGRLVKSVKISVYNNKYVLSWKMKRDDVYVDNNGKEQSIQEMEITYIDDKKEVVSLTDFHRKRSYKSVEVIKESKDKDGILSFTALDDSGQEITIQSLFVN